MDIPDGMDVAVKISGTGEMGIKVAPGVTADRLLLIAAYLTRIGNRMLDGAEMRQYSEQQALAEAQNGGRPS
jgi:hypothetical protein